MMNAQQARAIAEAAEWRNHRGWHLSMRLIEEAARKGKKSVRFNSSEVPKGVALELEKEGYRYSYDVGSFITISW